MREPQEREQVAGCSQGQERCEGRNRVGAVGEQGKEETQK